LMRHELMDFMFSDLSTCLAELLDAPRADGLHVL